MQAALSSFWKIWSADYLNSMQQRPRWRLASWNLAVDDVVVVWESTPPSTWRMERVVRVSPGGDGLVRVACVRIADGSELERSVRSLVPLLDVDE